MKNYTLITATVKHFVENKVCPYFFLLVTFIVFTNKKCDAQSAYTPNKLAVVIVGDGISPLTSAASPIFVKEFNLSGGGQTGILRTTLPTTANSGTGSVTRALTQSGTSGSEGFINLSVNRQYLTVAGYNSNVGTAAVSSTNTTTFPSNTRVVGKIDASGNVDTKTTINTAYNGLAIRSAVTVDGSAYWTAGVPGSVGVGYVPQGNIVGAINLNATNTRGITIFNNQLYVSSGAAGFRLATVGTGTPTTSAQTLTNLSGFLTTTGDPYSFSFIDINGGGPDVLYVASLNTTPSGLLKYTSGDNGATWTARGSLTGNVFGVTGFYNECNGNIELYITANTSNSKPNSLYKFSDVNVTTASPANIFSNGLALSASGILLATAATNTAFGGVAFTPGTSVNPGVSVIFNVTGGNGCVGNTTVGLSGSEPGVNYQLLNDGNVVATLPGTGGALNFGVQLAGTYTVVAGNLLSGCATAMTGTTVIYPLPTVDLTALPASSVCSGTSVILNGTGANSYAWTGGITNAVSFTPAITKSYTVAGTDANGCVNTATIRVTVNPLPIAFAVSNQTVCGGLNTNPINFTGSVPSVYNWTNSNPSIGLAASGTGNLPSFTAVNTGNSPISATITATPLYSGYAYISNLLTDNVSVIDRNNDNTVITTIPTGSEPSGLALSPDGNRLYVANTSSLDVSVINCVTNTLITTIPGIVAPRGIVVSPDGSRVYVVNHNSTGTVTIINSNTNSIIGSIVVGSYPNAVTVSPDGSRLYVANYNSDNVSVINTLTNTVIATVAVGSYPDGITISPDGSRVYVSNYVSNNISVINTTTNTVINSIAVGAGPGELTICPDGTRLYVSNTNAFTVSVINTNTATALATINVGSVPIGISSSPDGNFVYVANAGSNTVSIISTATNAVIGTRSVGSNPQSGGNFVSGTGCSGVPVTFTITVNPFSAASFTGLATGYCVNQPVVTLTGNHAPLGNFSGAGITDNGNGTAIFNPATAGVGGPYSISYSDNSNGCSSTTTQTVVINQSPTITGTTTASRCGAGTVILGATGSAGSTINWYSTPTGTSYLGSGNSFTTAIINTTTQFYAEAFASTPVSGLGNTSIPSLNSAVFQRGIVFNADRTFTLVSAQYYSTNLNVTNSVHVVLEDNAGTQLQTVTLSIVQGSSPGWYNMNLNWDISPGTGYRLLADFSQSVSRQITGVDYSQPVWNNLSPVGKITSGYDGGVSTTSYNYFHNISILTGCTSGRVAVTATVTPSPGITVSATKLSVCSGNPTQLSVSSLNPNYTYSWTSVPAGFTATGSGPHTASPTVSTTYNVYAQDNTIANPSSGCGAIGAITVTVITNSVAINASAIPATICSGENVQLISNASANPLCTPVTSCNFTVPDMITNVTFGSINNTTACDGSTTGGFAYFPAFNPIVVAGSSMPLSVSTGGDKEGAAVWIDYNQNNIFEPSEQLISGFLGTNPATYSGNVTIPLTALNGVTRMRVRCIYNANPNTLASPPCTNTNFGETEDYKITIMGGASPAGSGFTYDWSSNSTFLSSTNINNPVAIAATSSQNYSVLVTDISTGCTATSFVGITVNPKPTVGFSGLSSSYCTNEPAITLTGSPAGGIFTGPGITGNVFDPAIAGPGTHNIIYSYTNNNGCSNAISQLVIVNPCQITYNLTLYLEGFYTGSSTMAANLFNLGLSNDPTACDQVTVNLWSAGSLANQNPDYTTTTILHTNGAAAMQFPVAVNGNPFYIAVKHRNSIETWSKFPVSITSNSTYDFSTNLNKAYDDGIIAAMKNVGIGIYALYAGDITQDGAIDGQDMNFIDNEVGFFGYNISDVNGDGATDGQDMNFVDNNSQLGLFFARPY